MKTREARCSRCKAEREAVRFGPKAGVRYRAADASRWRKTEPKCVEEKTP